MDVGFKPSKVNSNPEEKGSTFKSEKIYKQLSIHQNWNEYGKPIFWDNFLQIFK